MIIVSKNGDGDFASIQEAINAVDSTHKQMIYIKKGIYHEKLVINKSYLTLVGESTDETILSFNDYAKKETDGQPYGTFRSYSCLIDADHLRFANLTFTNTAGVGKEVGQAVAVYVDGDCIHFKNCHFLGHQDTLFTAPLPPTPRIPHSFVGPKEHQPRRIGRHYYESCFIKGDIDFIFGGATAYFDHCILFSNALEEDSYITAASTPKDEPYGYVFHSCQLIGDANPHSVYLGRPWREFAHVAYLNCYLGNHIKPAGWDDWGDDEHHKTVQFVEYKSQGPGAHLSSRVSYVKVIDDPTPYQRDLVLKGWNPTL